MTEKARESRRQRERQIDGQRKRERKKESKEHKTDEALEQSVFWKRERVCARGGMRRRCTRPHGNVTLSNGHKVSASGSDPQAENHMPTYSAETWARTSSVRHTTGNRRKQKQKKKRRQDGGMGVRWDTEQRNSQPQEHRVGHQFAWQKTDAWGEKLGIKEDN